MAELTVTIAVFEEDKLRLSELSKRLGMNKSAVVRLAVHILDGHVRGVQKEVIASLKSGDDYQRAFEHQILNDFDYLMSGRVRIKKSRKTLEEIKKTQIDLFG